LDYIPQLIIYIFIAAITPGPNNTIAFYTSFNFGIKQSVYLPIAAALGASLIQLAFCLGLGSIFLHFPVIQNALKFFGFAYLIYLAYLISKFELMDTEKHSKKITFLEFFTFQFMNPKLYIFASTTSVIFTNYSYNFIIESLIITLFMFFFTFSAIFTWIISGNIFLKLFNNNNKRKIINYLLSLSLVITALWILFT